MSKKCIFLCQYAKSDVHIVILEYDMAIYQYEQAKVVYDKAIYEYNLPIHKYDKAIYNYDQAIFKYDIYDLHINSKNNIYEEFDANVINSQLTVCKNCIFLMSIREKWCSYSKIEV